MAVKEVVIGETLAGPVVGRQDERGIRTYQLHCIVVTDDPKDGTGVAANAQGIPRRYDSWKFGTDRDTPARCKSIDAELRSGETTIWDVTCTFDTALGPIESGDQNPANHPPGYSWKSQIYQVPAIFDKNGLPILNSAGEEFDPPPMRDDIRWSFSFTRKELSFSTAAFAPYLTATNKDGFQGFKPEECRCLSINPRLDYDYGIWFWWVSYEFEFRRQIDTAQCVLYDAWGTYMTDTVIHPWDGIYLDRGVHELWLNPVTGKKELRAIMDNFGAYVRQPVKLDGMGGRLDPQAPRNKSVYIVHKLYQSIPFAPLNITKAPV